MRPGIYHHGALVTRRPHTKQNASRESGEAGSPDSESAGPFAAEFTPCMSRQQRQVPTPPQGFFRVIAYHVDNVSVSFFFLVVGMSAFAHFGPILSAFLFHKAETRLVPSGLGRLGSCRDIMCSRGISSMKVLTV